MELWCDTDGNFFKDKDGAGCRPVADLDVAPPEIYGAHKDGGHLVFCGHGGGPRGPPRRGGGSSTEQPLQTRVTYERARTRSGAARPADPAHGRAARMRNTKASIRGAKRAGTSARRPGPKIHPPPGTAHLRGHERGRRAGQCQRQDRPLHRGLRGACSPWLLLAPEHQRTDHEQ